MGQNNWGAVPLSDGLDTRPCKSLDPRPRLVVTTTLAFMTYADCSDVGEEVAGTSLEDDILKRKRVQIERNFGADLLVGRRDRRRLRLGNCSSCSLHAAARSLH